MTERKISQEAIDWGTEAMKEVEAYKAATPDWESKLKTLDQFKKERIILYRDGSHERYVEGKQYCTDDPTGKWPMILTVAEYAALCADGETGSGSEK